MMDDPGTGSNLRLGGMALAATAALIAISVSGSAVETVAGSVVIAGAALTVAVVCALAVLAGRTDRWFRVALATAIVCAAAGALTPQLRHRAPAKAGQAAVSTEEQPRSAAERVDDLVVLADEAARKQDRTRATGLLDQALAIVDSEIADDLPRRDSLLKKILPILAADENTPAMLERIRGHVDRLGARPSPDFVKMAELADEAGRLAGAGGNLEVSVGWFQQAIDAREQGMEPLKAAFVRVNLALSLKKLGRNAEARAVLDRALPVLDDLPADHPALGTARAMAAELSGSSPAGSDL
jgi:tetratricopeptide (TPR) repeat protein